MEMIDMYYTRRYNEVVRFLSHSVQEVFKNEYAEIRETQKLGLIYKCSTYVKRLRIVMNIEAYIQFIVIRIQVYPEKSCTKRLDSEEDGVKKEESD
ncbi:hypothetical protein CWI38_0210p0030 [Hamiltosporidium tvaerminnensis]|uniref:Uncharacterized protein n=1 Tax=Hamiltosporidium tvaerminnensis TaxID=1176355 RepID=A0A4Q9M2G0_9MICR|nr:hypothetical protein CWI38_0210p0030 [Hamiltosporidium tvaerminnensis]